jgi:hypothetical protein
MNAYPVIEVKQKGGFLMINEKAGEEGSSTLACLIICLDKFRKAAEENLQQGIMPKVLTQKFSNTRRSTNVRYVAN